MIFPDYLKEFESDLLKYKLDYIKIDAKPIEKETILDFIQSKFLGKPYLPIGFEYPKDNSGKPMILLAQLNFSEIPRLENYPEKGILQFYIPSEDWYDMAEFKVIYHAEINDNETNFDFLTEDLYEDFPVYCEHILSFSKEEEYGGTEDFRFDYSFNDLDYWEFQENLNKSQQEEMDKFFYNTGHKIGGYAFFTQSDPRDYNKNAKNDVLLFQMDTDEEIMFGDSGVANFFINEDDLINKRFKKAYFNWDCC
ncbi:Uncharacterized protein YwqG [Flavobacterium sp. CF108]|uniref:YwqG family protein n=1 Tax=unclassified Flavobacterium TaxID=196869 RepID=UPI0008B36EE6|nr:MULTISPECIES: DUF1963 domain-containing protein [unclassified Flavobacterium]SEP35241.1 Uncharacterized protein YwqG [Flavobacterium sp. fv08]SHG62630.1 Uncharacterized protein YwqG [Flavobacterium sp. CF108]